MSWFEIENYRNKYTLMKLRIYLLLLAVKSSIYATIVPPGYNPDGHIVVDCEGRGEDPRTVLY